MKRLKPAALLLALLALSLLVGCESAPLSQAEADARAAEDARAWMKRHTFVFRAGDGHQYLVYSASGHHDSGMTHLEGCDHGDCQARRAFYKKASDE